MISDLSILDFGYCGWRRKEDIDNYMVSPQSQIKSKLKTLARYLRAMLFPKKYLRSTVSLSHGPDLPFVTFHKTIAGKRQLSIEDNHLIEFMHLQRILDKKDSIIELNAMYICGLRDVWFHTGSGVLCTSDNEIIIESAVDVRRIKNSPVYLRKIPKHGFSGLPDDTYSSIHGISQLNYFHWLIESIPRLYSLELYAKPVKLLIPNTLSAIQREILQICLPDNVSLMTLQKDESQWLRVSDFVFASHPVSKHKPHVSIEALNSVRTKVFQHFNFDWTEQPTRLIYISRENAKHARITNEKDLIVYVKSIGFEVHRAETLSFAEQVDLFRQARIIIAPHGAGLSNIIFAHSAKIIELHGHALVTTYFVLSQIKDLEYYYVLPSGFDPDAIPNPFLNSKQYLSLKKENYTVNILALQDVIAQVIPPHQSLHP